MHLIQGPSLTGAMMTAIGYHLDCEKPDAVLSIETHLFDVTIVAATAEFELDIGKQLHLKVGRWSRLIKEYVPKQQVERFVELAQVIHRGEAREGAATGMMFRDPPRHAKKHRWGGCLLSAVYRRGTLTVHSRTSYLGYMGHMDAALISTLASYIAPANEIRVVWHLSSMQFHGFKTLPFLFTDSAYYSKLLYGATKTTAECKRQMGPTWAALVSWFSRMTRDYTTHGVGMVEVEKYGPYKRVKRRWLEHIGKLTKNLPPSLLVEQLTFDKAVEDGTVDNSVIFNGSDDDED